MTATDTIREIAAGAEDAARAQARETEQRQKIVDAVIETLCRRTDMTTKESQERAIGSLCAVVATLIHARYDTRQTRCGAVNRVIGQLVHGAMV